jgi:hypothetical protein
VVACERDPVVAAAAREIVERNGYADVVRIVHADSRDLALGREMAEPADVLVWDNLGNNLVGAGGLVTVEDARRRLLKPDAVIIPYAAEIRVALGRTDGLGGMGTVEGFDLSPFDSLRRQATRNLRKIEHRSDAATLFAFDFERSPLPTERDAVAQVVATGGEANVILQWLTFQLHDDIRYDTGETVVTAFGIEAHPIEPFESREGRPAIIGGAHDLRKLWLWLQAR